MKASIPRNPSPDPKLVDQAVDLLADALTEVLLEQDREVGSDPEARRYLLRDLNGSLRQAGAGTGADVRPSMLDDPDRLLRPHLRASLEIPATELARESRERLVQWIESAPPLRSPERLGWANEAPHLLRGET
jgi:hypothetical protein